jgi:hypothetical protein
MSPSAKVTRAGRTLVVRVRLPARRRGARKLVVSPDGSPWTIPRVVIDGTIVKALARAHRWKGMLESGDYVSLTDLAKSEKINLSYLCRMLRLMPNERLLVALTRSAIAVDSPIESRADGEAFVCAARKGHGAANCRRGLALADATSMATR